MVPEGRAQAQAARLCEVARLPRAHAEGLATASRVYYRG